MLDHLPERDSPAGSLDLRTEIQRIALQLDLLAETATLGKRRACLIMRSTAALLRTALTEAADTPHG
ncbi:hypothetical protein DFH01_05855 [Falsiroseomonas bella]|uniref:Uncharacterized protein n=1 Tax=Falsiroseomonas bella TaxID=2184016 RepID=A0A317FJ33_9PROT|nr:hypothetical protein [Falsiroseomonas bella]PWS38775.1 hypothetical protein DFH01_05855 [Falsiroseomonas bella]